MLAWLMAIAEFKFRMLRKNIQIFLRNYSLKQEIYFQ